LSAALAAAGQAPLPDSRFVDCTHPWSYFGMLEQFAALQQRTARQQVAMPGPPGAPAATTRAPADRAERTSTATAPALRAR